MNLAVSLAKVADVDRNLGDENVAVDGFEEAIRCLESLKLDADETNLEQRVMGVPIISMHTASFSARVSPQPTCGSKTELRSYWFCMRPSWNNHLVTMIES